MAGKHLRTRVSAMLLAPVAAAAGLTLLPAAASAATCANWAGVAPVDPGPAANELNGVAAVSRCSAWVVGNYRSGNWKPLAEHWNGSFWKQTPVPFAGGAPHDNFLTAVAATSGSNVWAVGESDSGTTVGADQTDIQHWNGSVWAQVPSPDPGGISRRNLLNGVAATSKTNAWAVGEFSNGTADQTMILHWNGTAWKRAKTPNPGGAGHDNVLRGVTATSAGNAWAVGSYSDGQVTHTLVLHWNGKTWRRAASPSPRGCVPGDQLTAVSGTSATNAWAVGVFTDCFTLTPRTLIEHWNGHSWKVVTSPNRTIFGDVLLGVAAVSAGDAWAVGGFTSGNGPQQTLMEHWTGKKWRVVASANPAGTAAGNALTSVSASSASSIWAAGNAGDQTMAIHCC